MCGFTVINIIIDSSSLIYPTHLFTFQFILITCFTLILVHIILPPLFLSLCLPACLSVCLSLYSLFVYLLLSVTFSLLYSFSSYSLLLLYFFFSTFLSLKPLSCYFCRCCEACPLSDRFFIHS